MKTETSRYRFQPEGEHQVATRERQLLDTIDRYETRLLRAAWDTWSGQDLPNGQKRNWLVCAPTIITLTRILNLEMDVPIKKDGNKEKEEHIQLGYYLHVPEVGDPIDHVAATYYNGQGAATHIDFTGALSFGSDPRTGVDDLKGAIIVQKFNTLEEYNDALVSRYKLYPMDIDSPMYLAMSKKYNFPPLSAEYMNDWIAAINDDRITSPLPFIGDSGEEREIPIDPKRYGDDLAQFIRALVPGWEKIR